MGQRRVMAGRSRFSGGVPGASSDEPSIVNLIFADNYDSYVNLTDMSNGDGSNLCTVPLHAIVTDGQTPDPSITNLVSPGRGGSGKNIRSMWPAVSGSQQNAADWETWPEGQVTATSKTHYVTYYAKVTPSSSLASASINVKWIEFWQNGGSTRLQFNTRYATGTNPDPHNFGWEVICANDIGENSGQPLGPWPIDVWDGVTWVRYTYAVKSHTSSGNKDGFCRMWVNGTKIIDLCQANVGVVPTGGTATGKPWCTQAEVNDMPIAAYFDHIRLGGTQTAGGASAGVAPAWQMDLDDFSWGTD